VALAGAVAATTERLKIVLMIILPLYNPVRVAEDIAVLDLISQGRLEVIFGVGYVPSEFKLMQVPMNRRGRLFEEGVELVIKALKGTRFEADGREVFVTPAPWQRPHPQLYIAGSMQIAAHRAARFGVGFAPMNADLWETYDRECRALGHEPGAKLGWGGPINVYVADDPEVAWAKIAPYVAHHTNSYIRWAKESLAAGGSPGTTYAQIDPDDIRKSGKHRVLTPDECIALASELEAAHRPLILQPLIGGLPPEEGWKSLELCAKAVLPRLSGATAVAA
jgi:alkanesulfonate monooxygenase SsuD/methylene tetrahydromethanopterin reductase-like flavin-dependent oxidoreductase (luciferase family)